ncbi:MAG TPA: hypothetical protein VFG86_21875 [Chloroflexota bacterium]|jgi:hypothetical protein|nr:hypothetical protein [Chloroflexota bacterium]
MWIILALSVSLALVANVRVLQSPFAAPRDAADQYVDALKTGDVDAFLASLAPEARTELAVLARFISQPGTPAERRLRGPLSRVITSTAIRGSASTRSSTVASWFMLSNATRPTARTRSHWSSGSIKVARCCARPCDLEAAG